MFMAVGSVFGIEAADHISNIIAVSAAHQNPRIASAARKHTRITQSQNTQAD